MTVVWIQNAPHRLVALSTLFPDGGNIGKDSCGTIRRWSLTGENGSLVVWGSWDFIAQLPVCRCHVTISLLLLPPCLPQHDGMYLLKLNIRTTPVLLLIASWPELCNGNRKSGLYRLHVTRANPQSRNHGAGPLTADKTLAREEHTLPEQCFHQHMLNIWTNKCSSDLSYRAKIVSKQTKALKFTRFQWQGIIRKTRVHDEERLTRTIMKRDLQRYWPKTTINSLQLENSRKTQP